VFASGGKGSAERSSREELKEDRAQKGSLAWSDEKRRGEGKNKVGQEKEKPNAKKKTHRGMGKNGGFAGSKTTKKKGSDDSRGEGELKQKIITKSWKTREER